MKSGKLVELLKQGNFVIPIYLFKLRDKFSISIEEFIVLMYLSNLGDKFIFDPLLVSTNLNYSLEEVMGMISTLGDKGLLSVEVSKNEKGILEEYISLDYFYSKVSNILLEDINKDAPVVINIYEAIEREFGRTLSPMEYEIIKAWLDGNIAQELILEALRESIFNGVTNLRYIDKIIYEWGKKGFKTVDDVRKHHTKYKEEKRSKEKPEVFEYNWLDDVDE